MTKHLSDQPRDRGKARLREFTRQERQSGTHPAILALRARPQDRPEQGSSRLGAYTRIERGHSA